MNNHPIVRLYVEQMSFLCRADYYASYKVCEERFKKIGGKEETDGRADEHREMG